MNSVSCSKGHQNSAQAKFCQTCGESLLKQNLGASGLAMPLQPRTRLRDRYVVRQQLGQGGFGRTYLAEDTGQFNHLVVIKEFFPSLQGTNAFEKARELFQREANTLYRLQHPQIPRFGEIFQEQPRLFLVQEFIQGKSYENLLQERLRRGERFSEAEILQLFRDLLPVLSYLHGQSVIHRDISPDNIIQKAVDELPVLIDMGAVKQQVINATTQVQTTTAPRGTIVGKVGYAPDEQMRLGRVAPDSDLYAFAVTAIVLLTGKQPQQLLDQVTLEWLWERDVTVSPQLKQVLDRMLAPRHDRRFQSAEQVLDALEHHQPPITYTPPSSPTVSSPGPVVSNPAPEPQTATPINNSGQGKRSNPIPEEIKGWNWGAFLLPGMWCLTNQVSLGLLAWTISLWPVVGALLGAKGNEWAWKNRQWASVQAFKAHQRVWAIAGFLILGVLFVSIILSPRQ